MYLQKNFLNKISTSIFRTTWLKVKLWWPRKVCNCLKKEWIVPEWVGKEMLHRAKAHKTFHLNWKHNTHLIPWRKSSHNRIKIFKTMNQYNTTINMNKTLMSHKDTRLHQKRLCHHNSSKSHNECYKRNPLSHHLKTNLTTTRRKKCQL